MRRGIWGVIICFFVLFSLAPTFYELALQKNLQPDRQFELVHNYYTDYNFYLSRIREGREGAWTVTEKYTSEPHAGSYIQILYLSMGKVGALVGVPIERLDAIYHTSRLVLAVTLLLLVSYAAKWAFERQKLGWKIGAFLLGVTAASWPILVFHNGQWRFGGYMAWWSIMDSLQRITFLPHMLVGQALIVFLLVAMAQAIVMRKARNWIFLGLLAGMLGMVLPAALGFLFAVFGIFVGIDLLFCLPMKPKEWKEWAGDRILGPAIMGLISLPTLLYFSLMVKVYPWKRLIDYSMLHPQPFDLREYLLAVGPILLFGVIGGIWALLKRERRLFVFIAWAITWFAFIIAFQHIKQESPLRFTEMIPQVPLAFLACYLFYSLYHGLAKPLRSIFIIIPAALVVLGLGQMYSSWGWQKEFIDQKIVASQPVISMNNYIMYPVKDFITAMVYLEHTTPRNAVILSETSAGNYIPVISGNTVYIGHANTINSEQKEPVVHSFFDGSMGVSAAQNFLKSNSIHYVYFGPQEIDDGHVPDLAALYPFLTQIYKNNYVRIYHW